MTHSIDPLELSIDLMSKRSVSGERDEGALDLMQQQLESLGFTCTRLPYADARSYPVDNLFAIRKGTSGKHLAFAGHTDVVPAGDEAEWSVPPFAPRVVTSENETRTVRSREPSASEAVSHCEGQQAGAGDVLMGRGAVDMKAAICAWVAAIARAQTDNTLSLIITGDEEADAINGTDQMVDWVQANNLVPDGCLVGEPTNPTQLGEMIKVGRRGSLTFTLNIHGIQGHVAYPDQAENPITKLNAVMSRLINTPLDDGSGPFLPSHLEMTSVDVCNKAGNVIPAHAQAKFNIRFNDKWTRATIKQWVIAQIEEITTNYDLTHQRGSEAFVTPEGPLSDCVGKAVQKVTGVMPAKTTTGGTSDARFIRRMCPVVECGLINATAHQVDEHVEVAAIYGLTDIYQEVIETF